jgi:putative ABC transport system substrate-binding protein
MSKVNRHLWCFLLSLVVIGDLCPSDAAGTNIAVLFSREIAPYVDTVNGLESALGNRQVQRFFLDNQDIPYTLAGSASTLEPDQFAAMVAIGPGALRYLATRHGATPLLFGMVLNPQHILPDISSVACGVTLNIPVKAQFESISQVFPWLTRLGVLFDPGNNQAWFDQARPVAEDMGLELVPLQVKAEDGRLEVIGNLSRSDALLFIPDKSISSKVVIQHVIKQAVLQRIPVIGYNQFFLDSGAAAGFIIDYAGIGRQVADLLTKKLTEGRCDGLTPPGFTLRVNAEVAGYLRLEERRKRP